MNGYSAVTITRVLVPRSLIRESYSAVELHAIYRNA
jgi:hypothetical protein